MLWLLGAEAFDSDGLVRGKALSLSGAHVSIKRDYPFHSPSPGCAVLPVSVPCHCARAVLQEQPRCSHPLAWALFLMFCLRQKGDLCGDLVTLGFSGA